MGNDDSCRRTVLATLAAGTTVGIAGCAGLTGDSSDDDGSADDTSDEDPSTDTSDTPTPAESTSAEPTDGTDSTDSEGVSVTLTVVGADGEPLAQEPLTLLTDGDLDSTETVWTDSDGHLSTTVDVGTTSCSTLSATVVDRGYTVGLGCFTNGDGIQHRIHFGAMTSSAEPTGDPPTVGPSDDSAATVDVRVIDTIGSPVSGEPVLLRDTGGSLDEQRGETGTEGRLRFYEPTGPEPCNLMTVTLTDRSYTAEVGCLNDGETGIHTFTLLNP